jgi:hypothetical protein
MYPIDVPSLVRRNLIGANGDDPTLPHVLARRSRLVDTLRAVVRRRSRLACARAAGHPGRVSPGGWKSAGE